MAKIKTIQIRVTEEQREKFKEKAEEQGLNVSEYLRQLVCEGDLW